MKIKKLGKAILVAAGIVAVFLGVTVYAAVNQTIADGVYAHFDEFGGPATTRMRTLTIAPGEILDWHYHPGVGAYTIVKQGTLTVEDGCGGDTVYTAGQAFLEPVGRVHRGKNLGSDPVITAQMFIVPVGTPFTVGTGVQLCGRPLKVEQCKDEGWRNFNHPRSFNSQGDCINFVINGS